MYSIFTLLSPRLGFSVQRNLDLSKCNGEWRILSRSNELVCIFKPITLVSVWRLFCGWGYFSSQERDNGRSCRNGAKRMVGDVKPTAPVCLGNHKIKDHS